MGVVTGFGLSLERMEVICALILFSKQPSPWRALTLLVRT